MIYDVNSLIFLLFLIIKGRTQWQMFVPFIHPFIYDWLFEDNRVFCSNFYEQRQTIICVLFDMKDDRCITFNYTHLSRLPYTSTNVVYLGIVIVKLHISKIDAHQIFSSRQSWIDVSHWEKSVIWKSMRHRNTDDSSHSAIRTDDDKANTRFR